jgi:hypothetical protein
VPGRCEILGSHNCVDWWNKRLVELTQQKIQQDATIYQNLLFHIYMKLNMLRTTHRPSSGA